MRGRLHAPPGSRRPGVYRGWVRNIEPDRARAAMVASYQAVTDDVGKLDQDELARPSGCRGWSRGDLLFHMLLDAQRALVTFATPASGEADVDFISYWTPFRPGAEGYAAHARFVRRMASSYRSDLVIAGLAWLTSLRRGRPGIREWGGSGRARTR